MGLERNVIIYTVLQFNLIIYDFLVNHSSSFIPLHRYALKYEFIVNDDIIVNNKSSLLPLHIYDLKYEFIFQGISAKREEKK